MVGQVEFHIVSYCCYKTKIQDLRYWLQQGSYLFTYSSKYVILVAKNDRYLARATRNGTFWLRANPVRSYWSHGWVLTMLQSTRFPFSIVHMLHINLASHRWAIITVNTVCWPVEGIMHVFCLDTFIFFANISLYIYNICEYNRGIFVSDPTSF